MKIDVIEVKDQLLGIYPKFTTIFTWEEIFEIR